MAGGHCERPCLTVAHSVQYAESWYVIYEDDCKWCCLTTASSIVYTWGATTIWRLESCTQAGSQHCIRERHEWGFAWQVDQASLQEHVELT